MDCSSAFWNEQTIGRWFCNFDLAWRAFVMLQVPIHSLRGPASAKIPVSLLKKNVVNDGNCSQWWCVSGTTSMVLVEQHCLKHWQNMKTKLNGHATPERPKSNDLVKDTVLRGWRPGFRSGWRNGFFWNICKLEEEQRVSVHLSRISLL